jgi:NMD protein affecting ribosome stability and mRNA decay
MTECNICGADVEHDDAIAIRHASGELAHDWHAWADVQLARINAGADPKTAQDVPTPAIVDREESLWMAQLARRQAITVAGERASCSSCGELLGNYHASDCLELAR